MSSDVPPDKMQKTGILISWLAGSAVVGVVIFFAGFVRSNTTSGTHGYGPVTPLANEVAPYLGFVVVAAEAFALILLVVGVVCWPSRIFRSPRWVLSALGIVFVAAAILLVAYIAAVIATAPV